MFVKSVRTYMLDGFQRSVVIFKNETYYGFVIPQNLDIFEDFIKNVGI